MDPTRVLLLAFLIGVIAGLRSLTAPAAVAWAAHRNWLNLHNTPLSFMGSTAAVGFFYFGGCRRAGRRSASFNAQPAETSGPDCARRFRRTFRRGDCPGWRPNHCDRGCLGCGWRPCRRVCRLPSSDAPGEGAQGSGPGHRAFGRCGGDRRGPIHCVAALSQFSEASDSVYCSDARAFSVS